MSKSLEELQLKDVRRSLNRAIDQRDWRKVSLLAVRKRQLEHKLAERETK